MIKIALAPGFRREYEALSEEDQHACDAALEKLPAVFGHPHVHAGLGVRALRRGVFECRASQAVRIGFTVHGEILLLRMVGNHDRIRTWLRNNL